MTTDKGKRGVIRDETAPLAAEGPVIDSRPVPPQTEPAAARAKAQPPADSSLLGEGGVPPASARTAAPGTGAVWGHGDGKPSAAAGLMDEPLVLAQPSATGTSAPEPGAKASRSLPPSPSASSRRGGFWPLALGGAVAAALGAAAAWTVKPQSPAVPAIAPAGLTAEGTEAARGAGAEAARAEITTQAGALAEAARQAGAEAGTSAAAKVLADAPPAVQAAAHDSAALSAQDERIAALEARISELARQPAPAPVAATTPAATPAAASAEPVQPGTLEALRAEVTAQAQRIEELAARPALDPSAADELRRLAADAAETRQAISATAAEVDARLKDAAGKVDTLGVSVADTARRAEQAAAAVALQSALMSGSAAPPAADQLRAAGIEAPEALDQPIPPLGTLQREFPDAARAALKAALRDAGAAGDTGSGLTRFLRAQTGARSVTPREGSDPDAILSRAGAAVTAGDIRGALTQIATLPPAAQTAMAGWTTRAQDWAIAREALGTLETQP